MRFRDCDAMGHVNNAVYFTYMEQARFAYAQHVLAGDAASLPIILARAECDFKAQATYGDVLDVFVRLTRIGRASFTLEYDVVDVAGGASVATGRSVQVAYDYAAQRSMAIPDRARRRLEHELS